MVYVPVPDPVLDIGKPGRSTDWKQLRDDIVDLNTRLSRVEPGGFFSHFQDNNLSGDAQPFRREGIYLEASGAASFTPKLGQAGGTIDQHAVGLATAAAVGVNCAGVVAFDFSTRVKPLTFKARLQWDAKGNISALRAGFMGEAALNAPLPTMTAATRPANGVFLELGGAANTLRFVSGDGGTYAGAGSIGSDFAIIANNTWFEVWISFTDAGGNQALCYIDTGAGPVLQETLTAHLPTAKNLYGCVSTVGSGVNHTLVDRIQGSPGAGVVDLT